MLSMEWSTRRTRRSAPSAPECLLAQESRAVVGRLGVRRRRQTEARGASPCPGGCVEEGQGRQQGGKAVTAKVFCGVPRVGKACATTPRCCCCCCVG
jgi:hypothetical protein